MSQPDKQDRSIDDVDGRCHDGMLYRTSGHCAISRWRTGDLLWS
jgi:hypothetical protein